MFAYITIIIRRVKSIFGDNNYWNCFAFCSATSIGFSLINLRGWFEYSIPKPEMIMLSIEIRKTKINIMSFNTIAAVWSLFLLIFKPPIIMKNIATTNCETKRRKSKLIFQIRGN